MSTNYDQMEEIWGLGAIYSEYQINDRICYTLEGQTSWQAFQSWL